LEEAKGLLLRLREPNETRFGYSRGRPAGAGIGYHQAQQLFDALAESSAIRTGFISSLEECELMIDGIGRDKVSDLTTNIIRANLVDYTRGQCELHGVPTQNVPLGPCFNLGAARWGSGYVDLPVWRGKPVLLVPKAIARFEMAYDHQRYYRHHVLTFLQAEGISASSSLVKTLKNGRRVLYKKALQEQYPCTKDFLFRFSKGHPNVLREYRAELEDMEKSGRASTVDPDDRSTIAGALGQALSSIPAGAGGATDYHRLMTGMLEFLFFPHLMNPIREREIHDGRKRIDILMENGARDGIFWRLHEIQRLPCQYVPIECKNYSTEVRNPDVDQLARRFSVNRGQVGFLCCRFFEDRAAFVRRCRDA
jgi:hypothetical protein